MGRGGGLNRSTFCFGWTGCGWCWAMGHALARVGQEPRPRDVVVALIGLMALAAIVMAANVMWWGIPAAP